MISPLSTNIIDLRSSAMILKVHNGTDPFVYSVERVGHQGQTSVLFLMFFIAFILIEEG